MTEWLGDAFEEAVDHVLSRPGALPLHAGPRLPLPISRVASGYLGWQIELRGDPTGAPSPPWGVLYLLVVPAHVGAAVPRAGETPVQGVYWSEVVALEPVSAGARLLLLAHPTDPSDLPCILTLAEDVRAEFRPDQD
jgi:hypothetical protein